MDPITISCPSCSGQLRLLESHLGKQVRCPSCKSVFTATAPGQPNTPGRPPRSVFEIMKEEFPPPARREDEPEQRRRPRDRDDDYDDGGKRPRSRVDDDDPEPYTPPRRRSRRFDDDEDDDYADFDRGRISRRRGNPARAASEVSGPAISLIIVGILGILMGILNIIAVSTEAGPFNRPRNLPVNEAERVGQIFGACFSVVWGGMVLFGGISMKNMSSYGMAMTGSIFGIIPCNPCCLLGLPFGIWALTVLNQPDVKEAFR